MSKHGHNGGPPLIEDDEGDIRMRYARIHISDFLNGIRKLPLEARGFYVTGLFCMYDNMGSLPADDRMAALQMNCDIRTYRRLRSMMLDASVFGDKRARWSDTGDGLSQSRVQDEISEYCKEFRNRRDAALKREADRRLREVADAPIGPIEASEGQNVGPLASENQTDLSPLPTGLADAPSGLRPTKSQQRANKDPTKLAQSSDFVALAKADQKPELSRKPFNNNDGTTTVVPQLSPQPTPQNGGHPKHKHKHLEEREEKIPHNVEHGDAGALVGALAEPGFEGEAFDIAKPDYDRIVETYTALDFPAAMRAADRVLHFEFSRAGRIVPMAERMARLDQYLNAQMRKALAERRAAESRMAAAHQIDESCYFEDHRLVVANGFREDLLSKVGRDENRLISTLEKAASNIPMGLAGPSLRKKVLGEFVKQRDWDDQAERKVRATETRSTRAGGGSRSSDGTYRPGPGEIFEALEQIEGSVKHG